MTLNKIKFAMKRLLPNKMHGSIRHFINITIRIFDVFIAPLTILSSAWIKSCRKKNFRLAPITKKILHKIGIFPIIDHYYEPLFNPEHLRKSLREDRYLPAIDLNIDEQLRLLESFKFNEELLSFPRNKSNNNLEYSYDNSEYSSGDSECLYSMIRIYKPKTIIEIGCGSSTLMAINAVNANKNEDSNYLCDYTCIEPYEQPWLEQTGLRIIRKKVEEVPLDAFKQLGKNDILFIDSSHIIRPQGDVLYEILEILPSLNPGVLIHLHDVLSPKDYYPDDCIGGKHFWNEQYLLEAFISYNEAFKVILSTNHLLNNYFKIFISKCPNLKIDRDNNPERETGAFWLKKVK